MRDQIDGSRERKREREKVKSVATMIDRLGGFRREVRR